MSENSTPVGTESTENQPKKHIVYKTLYPEGFVNFLKKFGIIGIAIGFVTGAAVSKLVASLNDNIINPILSMVIGKANLAQLTIGPIKVGAFASSLVDFMIIMVIVYLFISIFVSRFMDTNDLMKK